jgi:hypothetical protein
MKEEREAGDHSSQATCWVEQDQHSALRRVEWPRYPRGASVAASGETAGEQQPLQAAWMGEVRWLEAGTKPLDLVVVFLRCWAELTEQWLFPVRLRNQQSFPVKE